MWPSSPKGTGWLLLHGPEALQNDQDGPVLDATCELDDRPGRGRRRERPISHAIADHTVTVFQISAVAGRGFPRTVTLEIN